MAEFVSLLSTLAWPVASLLIAALFRRELRLAMGRLGQVKYGAVEVNFRDDLRKAEHLARSVVRADEGVAHPTLAPVIPRAGLEAAEADTSELVGTMVSRETPLGGTVLVAAGSRGDPKVHRNLDALHKLCQDSPRLAILEAWDDLAHAAILAATSLGDRRSAAPIRVESAVRFLVDRGWLNAGQGQLVDQLRQITVAVDRHDAPVPTPDDARRVVDLIAPLIDRVGSLVRGGSSG